MKRLILILMLFPVLAFADPGSATRYLINEPASLMDIGLLRAKIDLADAGDIIRDKVNQADDARANMSRVFIYYEFADDLIVISSDLGISLDLPSDSLKAKCFDVLTALRFYTDVHFVTWFQHSGYAKTDNPEDLSWEVASRTELRCSVMNVQTQNALITARTRVRPFKIIYEVTD